MNNLRFQVVEEAFKKRAVEVKTPKERPSHIDPKRLMRTSGDKVIGGVCGGIAHFTNIDPTLLRIITLLCIVFGGLSLWISSSCGFLCPLIQTNNKKNQYYDTLASNFGNNLPPTGGYKSWLWLVFDYVATDRSWMGTRCDCCTDNTKQT